MRTRADHLSENGGIAMGTNGNQQTWQSPTDSATVLVVEDDPALRSILVDLLRQAGYGVLSTGEGEAALGLATAEETRPDLVLLDLTLPGISGVRVLQRLRQESGVPVLVVSARDGEQDAIDCLDLGADGFVVKPFGLSELLARVGAAIRRGRWSPLHRAPVLRRGSLTIEPDQRRVRLGDQVLPLRPRAADVLEVLAVEPGRVFSRGELLREIWHQDETAAGRNRLDATIFRLRWSLVHAGLAPSTITTIPNRGYRFVTPPDLLPPADSMHPSSFETVTDRQEIAER